MANPSLPNASALLADPSGRPTREWYYFYRQLALNQGGGAAAWGSISGDITAQLDLQSALGAKAPVDSPTFTGNPKSITPSPGDNDTSIATTAFVADAVATSATGGFVPTLMGSGESFTVPANKQALFAAPITIGLGTLNVFGTLVEVS